MAIFNGFNKRFKEKLISSIQTINMQLKDRIKKNIDKIWTLTGSVDYEIILNRTEKPFELEAPDFIDEKVNQSLLSDNKNITHSEYIRLIKRSVIIEPDYAYCLTGLNKIVSFTAAHPRLLPSYIKYVLSFFKKKKSFDTAILFDGDIGLNYFHFFSDVINKIWLLSNIEKGFGLPLIIGEKTYNTKYFQYFLKNTELKKYNWVVQNKGEYMRVNCLYILKPLPYNLNYFEQTKRILNIPFVGKAEKKIFLDRSSKVGRRISNFNEIEPILLKYGFEIFDTADKELDFQVNLYQSTKYLIGPHGAANTNIIFSDKDLHFLEISASNRIGCHYYWLSKIMDIKYYDVILGGEIIKVNAVPESDFYLDPVKFEKAVIKMLTHV